MNRLTERKKKHLYRVPMAALSDSRSYFWLTPRSALKGCSEKEDL